MSRCICDFPSHCAGSGWLTCLGCGGDFCVCAECFGHGEMECDGCGDCGDGNDYSIEDGGDLTP